MIKELRNKLLSQALLVLSQIAFPLITYPVITKALGAQQLGKVNFADSVVQALFLIGSLGIPLYGIREIAITKNQKKNESKTFWELYFLQLFFSVPSAICFWIVGVTSHIDHHLLFIGLFALIGNSLTCEWFFQGTEAFFFVAIRSVAIRTISTLFILILIKTPADYSLYYLILSASVIVTMVLNFMVISAKVGFRFTGINPWQHLKKIKWVYACYSLTSLYAVLDSLLLGWLSTDNVVGYYSFGYRLVRMSSMLIPTLGVVFIPKIAFHHFANDKKEVKAQIHTSQQIIFFFGIPLCLFFLVLAPEIISIFASKDFIPTTFVIRILSPIPLLFALSHLTGTQILISIKKEKRYFIFLVVGCLLNLSSNFILIPLLQEKGAAISNVLSEGFVAIGTVIYLRNQNFFSLSFKMILSCFFSALVFFPVAYGLRLLKLSPVLILGLTVVIAGMIYVIIHFKFISRSFAKNLSVLIRE